MGKKKKDHRIFGRLNLNLVFENYIPTICFTMEQDIFMFDLI